MTSRHADTRGRVYGQDSIRRSLSQQSWEGNARRLWLLLQPGDSAWTPDVRKPHAYGPASVCYTQYFDGSIDIYVAD